jgi:hypothetical protein
MKEIMSFLLLLGLSAFPLAMSFIAAIGCLFILTGSDLS